MKRLFIILSFVSISATAQQLKLQDAINIALKNSLDIQLAKNVVDQNAVLNHYGVAGGLPLVSATLTDNEQLSSINQKFNVGDSATRTIKTNNVASNNLAANVTAGIVLYNGMRIVSTKKRLEQLQSQSEQILNSQVQNTIAAVMTKYFDVVRQENYTKTIQQSIEASKERLKILEVRKSAGLANNADIFQAQIDLNTLNQALESQKLVIDQAKTDLLTLLTLKADSSVTVIDTIEIDQAVMLDSVLNNLTTNADIIAADQQVRINQLIVKETAAQRYPTLSANGGYSYSRNQNAAGQTILNTRYGPTIGINLAIPIYNGSAVKRQQRAAEIGVNNAELQKRILIRDYEANAVKTYQAYQNTLNQYKTERRNYQLTQDLLSLVMERFRLRVATIIELRDAQQSFEQAGYRLVNLAYAAKASEIELKRVANKLSF
ncbi:TolC family protein [Foetidibacter luteolus]|uniref:TolC family protein n=1 Tax=Foetidibacter luteolus TaxID=2608880 RepID=UPI00129A878D|nr:TolC family protein [Foetidibacter luteolus]